MPQETPDSPDTLETLISQALSEAELPSDHVKRVREGILDSLKVLAAQEGYRVMLNGAKIDFDLPVAPENRDVLKAVVEDSIISVRQLNP